VDAFFFKLISEDQQETVPHQLVLAGHFVGDSVDLHCGFKALERKISLRIHLIFSLKVYKIIRFKRGLPAPYKNMRNLTFPIILLCGSGPRRQTASACGLLLLISKA
jgi:hypothetical protein